MSSNEVEIVVVAEDQTGQTWSSVTAKAKKSGADAGKEFGDGFNRGSDGRLRDSLGRFASEGASAGTSLGINVGAGFTKHLGTLGPAVVPVVTGVVAGAAPAIGALLAASVIGAAGAGGIIGGIMLVKDDPRIQAAATTIGANITKRMKVSAQPFVEPVLAGLNTVDAALDSQSGRFDRIFAKASTWVDPLADAAAEMIDDLSAGFEDLIGGADPVMRALTDGFVELGEAIGDSMTVLSEVGPEAATALSVTLDLLSAGLVEVTETIGLLAKAFGFLAESGLLGPGIQAEFELYKAQAQEAADSTGKLGEEAADTRNELEKLADELRAQTDPIFALMDAQGDAADAQDKYNDAVRKHGRDSQEAQEALRDLAKAEIDVQSATGAAADMFGGKMPDSLRQTLIAAGWSAEKINDLERQMQQAHSAGNRFAKTYKATVVVNGIEWNIQKLRELDRSIRNLPKSKQVQIVTQHLDVYNKVGGFSSRSANAAEYGARASGGPVYSTAASGGARGALTLVGERGPELVTLPYGSTVKTNGATMAELSAAAGELLDLNNDAGRVNRNMSQKGASADLQRARAQLASMYGKDTTSYAYQRRKGKFKGDWVDFHSMQAWLKNMSEWEDGRNAIQGTSAGSGPNRGYGNVNGRGMALEVRGDTDSAFATYLQRMLATGQITISSRNVA